MNDLTPVAMAWFAGHHGVITTAELRSRGVGRSTTDRLTRAGVLHNPHKGVYVLASAKSTLEVRCAVAVRRTPSGFVTGPTAGSMLGLRRMPRAAGLHFAVRHGVNPPRETGVVFRQSTAVLASHMHRRSDGITIAKPARLALILLLTCRRSIISRCCTSWSTKGASRPRSCGRESSVPSSPT